MGIYILFVVVLLLICLLLGLIVLIQNPKGGGLDSAFGLSTSTFGAQQTSDFLEKGTWYLAIALLVVSLTASLYIRSVNKTTGSEVRTEGIEPNLPTEEAPSSFTLPVSPEDDTDTEN